MGRRQGTSRGRCCSRFQMPLMLRGACVCQAKRFSDTAYRKVARWYSACTCSFRTARTERIPDVGYGNLHGEKGITTKKKLGSLTQSVGLLD